MDLAPKIQGSCSLQESNECHENRDENQMSDKGAEVEHVVHSAEIDAATDGVTWNDGTECSNEGNNSSFGENNREPSDFDKSKNDKVLVGDPVQEEERIKRSSCQHIENGAGDLVRGPELSNIKNHNDELPSENAKLNETEKGKALGDFQDLSGFEAEIVSGSKAMPEKESDSNATNFEIPYAKQAVSNDVSSDGGIQQEADNIEASIEGKDGIYNDNLNEKPAKCEDRNVEANEEADDNFKSDAKDSSESEWVDILGNGLLKKKVIVKGQGQETRPKPGNEVTMIVNGELMDGTKLKEEKLVFIHDDRELIQAFELAVALMELGEKAILYTDAKYAYGPFGCESLKIPKNCSITYTLEIISILEGPDKDKLTDDERVKIGDKKRVIGNGLYSRGDYGSAIDCYKRALKYLDGSANKAVIDMKVKCQNNLSAAQLKVNAYQAALQSCNGVLALQPQNIKAMFRKSKCLEAVGRQDEALKCLKEASMIDPDNKMVYNDLIRLSKYMTKSRQKESDMYKRMVGGMKKKDEIEGKSQDNNLSFKVMIGTLVVAGLGILTAFIWNRH